MKLAIICAMAEELEAVNKFIAIPLVSQIIKAGNTYYHYRETNQEIVTVVSGIGKVNAAVTTQILLDNFDVDYVVNVGVAGSLSTDLTFGDIVIASDLVEHDIDVRSFGLPLGQIPRMDVFGFLTDAKLNTSLINSLNVPNQQIKIGRIVSGDQFIDNADKALFLHQEFNALACEMEGAAIAHVCYLNNKPFAVVRALSDMAGQDGSGAHSFEELKIVAADCAALVIENLLRSLK